MAEFVLPAPGIDSYKQHSEYVQGLFGDLPYYLVKCQRQRRPS